MFCRSRNNPDETKPNVNICPVCLAHPGTLPVINREAVRHVLRVGVALKGVLADYTEFDRKNYFYPDLPKGYQLSQYEYPLVAGGTLNGVAITRVHLEEDTASSMHEEGKSTVIDFNRAGVPLMELVTEPVIHSAKEAGDFARELQLLLRCLDASEANMEKGEMRVEANISVAPLGQRGTKVEIKNLNSFRATERAVQYEIKRQSQLLEKGEKVSQETRGWDENKQATFPQRIKEGSADYRYFPDPDLPSLRLSELKGYTEEEIRKDLPELPSERRERYLRLGIKSQDAQAYVSDPSLGAFFEAVAARYAVKQGAITLASNYVANDLVSLLEKRINQETSNRDIGNRDTHNYGDIPISARNFSKIIDLLISNRISSRTAKDLLSLCIEQGGDPEQLANEKGLIQADSSTLAGVVESVLAQNQSVVEDYKRGKEPALQFLIGQAMKASKGSGNPKVIGDLLKSKIG
ncbi:MAG: hypothetical protein RLZZ416_554 [Candidatus Parcubacteria bacterium]